MFDLTRGRMPKLDYLKSVIEFLSKIGINQVQIYMEHTFNYSFMGEFFEDRYGYDANDLRSLDIFCHERNVELIPCIATFGHLYEILQDDVYKHLCELPKIERSVYSWDDRQIHHTIDCSNPESLKLVQQMIEEICSCFSSPYLNICGDETFDIGKGKAKAYVDVVGEQTAYIDFLNNIMDSVFECGKIPMYWGDVVLEHPERIQEINEEAIALHWWYNSEVPKSDFEVLEHLGRPYYTCPSTAGWNHFISDYKRSMTNINKMLDYGYDYGAIGSLLTDWGDYGHVNHLSSSIPMMIYFAKKAMGQDVSDDQWMTAYINIDYFNLLKDAGNERLITFEFLMKWYYNHFNNDTNYGDYNLIICDMDLADLEDSLDNINTFLVRLNYIPTIGDCSLIPKKDEMQNNLEGAKWMVQFVIYLKTNRKKQMATELMNDIQTWFQTYKVIWRKNNLESELFRIEEVIKNIITFTKQ